VIRKSCLMVSVVLAATLVPSVSKAEVYTCGPKRSSDLGPRVATIVGTPGDDTLYGTASEDGDVIVGLGGNDTIYGTTGWICGNGGADVIYSSDGEAQFGGRGDDLLNGDSDRLYGGPGDDRISGPGFASYEFASGPITANLATGIVTGQGTDTLVGIDHILASASGDTLIGNGKVNYLGGLSGDDVIKAGGGDDPGSYPNGQDLLSGGGGNDRLFGQTGPDTILGSRGDDTLRGGDGRDYIDGSDGVEGNDFINGMDGRDGCTADEHDEVLSCVLEQ
jgi:Ca2+-binding RTX toxin-like protein